jgi:hypothetical protein
LKQKVKELSIQEFDRIKKLYAKMMPFEDSTQHKQAMRLNKELGNHAYTFTT